MKEHIKIRSPACSAVYLKSSDCYGAKNWKDLHKKNNFCHPVTLDFPRKVSAQTSFKRGEFRKSNKSFAIILYYPHFVSGDLVLCVVFGVVPQYLSLRLRHELPSTRTKRNRHGKRGDNQITKRKESIRTE